MRGRRNHPPIRHPIATASTPGDTPGIVAHQRGGERMSVRDVQLVMIAGMTASKIRAAGRADEIVDWALSEAHTVAVMWGPENGQPARPHVWNGVRIAPEEHGLFRALVAECRLETGTLPDVETMIGRARARLGLAPGSTPRGWTSHTVTGRWIHPPRVRSVRGGRSSRLRASLHQPGHQCPSAPGCHGDDESGGDCRPGASWHGAAPGHGPGGVWSLTSPRVAPLRGGVVSGRHPGRGWPACISRPEV